jgi:hypothetical protein
MKRFFVVIFPFLLTGCSMDYLYRASQRKVSHRYETLGFKDLLKKYMQKEGPADPMEGIYLVTREVTREFKNQRRRNRLLDRDENYKTVAVLADTRSGRRSYIEIPVDKDFEMVYAIRGEIMRSADADVFFYTHILSRSRETYTMVRDSETGVLEAVRSQARGGGRVIYKYTFVKLAAK